DDGPLHAQTDIWGRIDADLGAGDVNGAAHKLRRHLEASTADIAEAIGGRVAFRGDANYDLGEFMSAVKSKHGDLLKTAAVAAASWGIQDAIDDVQAKRDERAAAIQEQDSENWIVN